MTKHDTWVELKPGNPYEPILDLFPDGMIPMRDPFPLERVTGTDGKEVALWIVDLERLSSIQAQAIAQIVASNRGADVTEVAAEAAATGGFAMNNEWIESMKCWSEGFHRGAELADFLETAPPIGTPEAARAFREFYNSQYDRWIDGNEQPRPINSIDDIDPRLRTPGLEQILKMQLAENAIATGGYSVFDVLTGRATVDVLNKIDPDNQYSLVGENEDFDDEDVYE
ncbi:hypothetical protein I8752_29105 [Nostocaceae cyanobacterium CENA369]|uniref:Uncharacterized protein n=1 Tax=Dendronalium phyllosphericum CENA369 TaxID=1725256 RepID=A0A8J7I8U6_9NOST|nr:hypothetical protein [Dendronalium phyllosphericum]MBH8576970.1 hypothetical protein [Dendronalium phyllosphericum CENA369]